MDNHVHLPLSVPQIFATCRISVLASLREERVLLVQANRNVTLAWSAALMYVFPLLPLALSISHVAHKILIVRSPLQGCSAPLLLALALARPLLLCQVWTRPAPRDIVTATTWYVLQAATRQALTAIAMVLMSANLSILLLLDTRAITRNSVQGETLTARVANARPITLLLWVTTAAITTTITVAAWHLEICANETPPITIRAFASKVV
jgi:hypothetical protein